MKRIARRALLTAGIASVAAQATPARAASGDPLILGQSNKADTTTSLRNTDSGAALPALSVTAESDSAALVVHNPTNGGQGIRADATGGSSVGVVGSGTLTGVMGSGRHNGVHGYSQEGVALSALSPFGVALDVQGRAHFNRSGQATIPAGTRRAVVPVRGVESSSMVLATVQGPGTVGAKAGTDNITLFLPSKASADTEVAWLVLD
jgi:hypothetical protein